MVRGKLNMPLITLFVFGFIVIILVGITFFNLDFIKEDFYSQEKLYIGSSKLSLVIENVYEEEGNFIIDVNNKIEGEVFSNIKFILSDGKDSEEIILEDVNLGGLETKSFLISSKKFDISKINKISVLPVVEDEESEQEYTFDLSEKSDSNEENATENNFVIEETTETSEEENATESSSVTEEIQETSEEENVEESNTSGEEESDSATEETTETSEECIPNCTNLECGEDTLCGQSCGVCPTGTQCVQGTCMDMCENECEINNQISCIEYSYRKCGNYDDDSCLEWGPILSCSSGYKCYSGRCVKQKVIPSIVAIVDFQDKKLEDYEGLGIKSVSDLENILDKMASHWEWMSVGTETQSWKIVRVTLSKKFTKSAYSDWVVFRNEIVSLIKKKIDMDLYDENKDGVIDNIFVILSSGEDDVNSGYKYIYGGASQNKGARIFLDPQGSTSVKGQVYGNFNHEIGHGRALVSGNGLPDIYGDYDTLSYLTLMSSSWPLPAFGFSAYERIRLGWVYPRIIDFSTTNVFLLPAEENLQAVRINTNNPKEYFLIEYRKKPSSGFGSSDYWGTYPNFNGLAIYHVNEEEIEEGFNQDFPPFIYFESADGQNDFPSYPRTNEFWFPGNSASSGVFEAKLYNSNKIIFTVENLAWFEEGIRFDVKFR